MSLKEKTFSSVRWTATSAVTRGALQVIQIAVLARLLHPSEYGLMAMVNVVVSFAVLLSDLGLNSAYVHRQAVSDAQRSSLFWLHLGVSGALTAAIAVSSPVLSWLLGDMRLTPLLILSATTTLIGAAGQQVRMTAEKSLDFRPVVLIEIGSALAGFGVAVSTAVAGCGVYSLVYGNIATALVATMSAWLFLSRGWRPMWRFSLSEVRPYLSFGGAAMTGNVINQLNLSIDLLLGGRLLGASQLGLFSVPRSLILQIQFVINPIITRVGFPLIAKVQGDRERVRSIYLQTMNVASSTNAPIYAIIAFFAPEVCDLMLGGRWGSAAPLLQILAVWGALRSTLSPVGSLLLGMGRADLALRWQIAMLVFAPPFLFTGSHFGLIGLVWSLLALIAVAFVPSWWVLVRPLCGATLREYSVAALRPMAIAAVAATPAHFLAEYIEQATLRLAFGVVFSGVLYCLLSCRFNSGWIDAMRLLLGLRVRNTGMAS